MLRLGAQRRAIAATDLNERSSRSHTIFSVEVNGATLRLADLAGSEKWRTEELRDYSKHRIKELTSINQSLSALANVVSALKDGRPHVPYRASKLTRLLRDAFCGGRCAFVATLPPACSNQGRPGPGWRRAVIGSPGSPGCCRAGLLPHVRGAGVSRRRRPEGLEELPKRQNVTFMHPLWLWRKII